MEIEKKSQLPVSRIEPDTKGVNVIYRPRSMTMHYISSEEIQTLGNASNDFSLYIGFFGVSIGVAGVCIATVTTVELTNPYTWFAYCAVLAASGPASIFLAIKSILTWKKTRQNVRTMLGETGTREEIHQ